MPPPHPRDRPALERSVPGDAAGSDHSEHLHLGTPALVLFGDGHWHQVELKARQRDRHGRWRYLMEWGALGSTWSGWYLAEAGKMREAEGQE